MHWYKFPSIRASQILTACPKGEHLLWIAAVLHHLSIAKNKVVLFVVVHRPQQAECVTIGATRQEHSGGYGLLPLPHLHASTRREHDCHVFIGRAKDKDPWQDRLRCESDWSLIG